jgi:hypothetical protein
MTINTAELLFDTLEKYDEKIALVESAIDRQLMIGAGNMNNSGGSIRSMTEAEFSQLKSYLQLLRKERGYLLPASMQSANIVNIRAGW